MNKDSAILAHDLMILEEMAAHMAAYLDSDIVDWTLPHANMPRLTIGGYLMRRQRLIALRGKLPEDEQRQLAESIIQVDEALEERVVRFEQRAHQELHMRIAEWIGFLRDLNRRARTEVNYYAGAVDTRIVIKELLDVLQSAPYQLGAGVLDEINVVDRLLENQFAEHSFVWDPIWEPAYPRDEYRWLYGCPRLMVSANEPLVT